LLLGAIRRVANVLPTAPRAVTPVRDPDDEPYRNLAIASGASFLVTRDKDLLDLMDDATFVSEYPSLEIVNPVELLRSLAP
jgi:predicted nucleic acid-binding protein